MEFDNNHLWEGYCYCQDRRITTKTKCSNAMPFPGCYSKDELCLNGSSLTSNQMSCEIKIGTGKLTYISFGRFKVCEDRNDLRKLKKRKKSVFQFAHKYSFSLQFLYVFGHDHTKKFEKLSFWASSVCEDH